jgi:transcription-repair coupling factor (superfamily II helicase)
MKIIKLWDQHIIYSQFLEDFRTRNKRPLSIKGLHGSALSFFISSLALKGELNRVLLCLTDNITEAMRLYQDLLAFTGWQENNPVFIFPPHEVLPYEDLSHDFQIVKQRIKVLSTLLHLFQSNKDGKDNYPFPLIIISTYRAILPKIMSCNKFYQQHLKLQREGQLKVECFLKFLIEQGYHSSGMIETQGQFSQRGGIIDVFPPTEENPLRIELDGDRIASLRFFDPGSQRSIKKIEEILLLPQRELSPALDEKEKETNSFFDYLPHQTDIFIHQFSDFEKNVQDFEKESEKSFLAKKDDRKDLLPPEYYYLTWNQVNELLYQKQRLLTIESWLEQKDSTPGQKIFKDYPFFPIETKPAENYFGNLEFFFKDIKKSQEEKQNILVLASNKGRALRLVEIFEDRGFRDYQIMALPEVDLYPGKVCLSYGQVNYGFFIPALNLSVITEQEIFGKQRDKSYKPRKFQGQPFYQLDELKIGDFVVHINHGIGQYAGIKSRSTDGIRRDYLLIKYAADDELYVPIEQLSMVHKYIGVGGNPPRLNRLGDSTWRITKRRVRESIQKAALELFELYRKRRSIQGFSFSSDTVWQQELEMAFPFEETPDQEKAFQDVKKDMESAQPMERLIYGDVGYGKTEIAIRAAFKAVMDSKQVAVLAPTTILAQQHWENFTERMKAFPVRIEMLSRFKSKKEQQEIVVDLKKGDIDIIIGTHRLVQPDVVFRDLGLLVVDEEQRFGVIHKERIKKIREQVDSLTLTATPIPRTLYLSLTGIREMSIINTPPELRLPIITFFKPKTDDTIREAIRRELERGGQVYYVYNRVQDIDYIAEKLNLLIPEAKVVIAHGQMPEEKLENIMIDFLNRYYDVLICTTIIEIGLDIPNVNTIIIDDAHQFGLSQLYQLRGRVGRSNRRAYAYLLYPTQKILSDNARKRLEAIKEFSDLGSGFRLAMRDLEIRGAGNLLGKEQHGFVSEVGFNYYCQLLEESINQLRQIETVSTIEQEPEPEIEAKLDSYIPEYYISNPELRISYYQRLSQIKTEKELNDLRRELQDVYGIYPGEVENLLLLVQLKLKLKNQGVTNIRITNRYVSIKYQIGFPLESKIKNALKIETRKNISYSQRGRYYELKMIFQETDNLVHSHSILHQYLSFLKTVIPETV